MFDHRLFALEVADVVKEFTAQTVAPLLTRMEELERRLAALPVSRDDAEVAILRLKPDIEGLEKRLNDHAAAVAEVDRRVAAEVRDRVESLPEPQHGRSPTAEELAPLIAEAVSKAVSALPKLAGMVIDRQGELIATMANGEQKSLGRIVGKDGLPGAAGKDGVGFDDLTAEYDGDRALTLKFVRGDQTKSFSFDLPLTIYRGTYKAETAYRKGDSVTYAGSQWIARRDTSDKPETSDAWQLSCKRGHDGKNGKDGAQGAPGPEGKAGRDLTQMDASGRKWT